ncbi:NAD-P-binding protein [Dentipellis sp. KUC8613]|nr:NAD-P-binding protein [Dentipellis sp. KUC8613]
MGYWRMGGRAVIFHGRYLGDRPFKARRTLDMSDIFSVEGLVAVITGGGSGIGLQMATALESNGATVYILGRRKDVLERAACEHSKHGRLIPLEADITSRPSLLTAAETVRSAHGYVDLLVNNAGVALSRHIQPPPPPSPRSASEDAAGVRALQRALWDEASPDDFRTSFAVNVAGAYDCTVAFLDLLHAANARRGKGGVTSQVLTVSSVAGFRRDERVYSVPYALSKAATTHLGKMLVNLLKEYKIRSNVLAPGIFPSDMTAGVVPDKDVAQDVPLQRAGGADDMAGMILYLASRAGAYVNGTVHMLDGGRMAIFPSTY